MSNYRVASFNVENLFDRPRVFNLEDKSLGDAILDAVAELNSIIGKSSYTAAHKRRILQLYRRNNYGGEKLSYYIVVREDRGKLFKRQGFAIVGVKAGGSGDWDGAIEFKRARFSDAARENTAKVIKAVKADVACIVEAENRMSLSAFNSALLDSRKFKYPFLIDGNDQRGIDVGLLSNFPIEGVWTHIFDKKGTSKTFSRDCLEVELVLPNGEYLYILCNHFKSRGYGSQATSDARRRSQSEAVAMILGGYDLASANVIVAGDLNDSPVRPPMVLEKLLRKRYLYDVLALQFPTDRSQRWTYHYTSNEQIDYLLVSKPLRDKFVKAGVERRGIHKVDQFSGGTVQPFDTVTHWSNQASDHGAVWAEFAF